MKLRSAGPHRAEARYASWLLRLLLSPGVAPDRPDPLDWDVLLAVARANGVLVRTAERLAAGGVALPDPFAAAVAAERRRIRATLALMRHVSRACRARGIAFVFPKAFQDRPDFGDDVDLLLLRRSVRVDRDILAGLAATPVPRDLGECLAGTTTYSITGCPSPLDVQHGRLGIVGEHHTLSEVLVLHARPIVVAGIEFAEPRREDQLVLQGLQRVAGRRRIALCDVVFTVSAVRCPTLDWDDVIASARRHGALPGLGCYLSYVDQVHQDAFGTPLLPGAVLPLLPSQGWGRIAYREGGYRVPIVRANSRLYWRQFRQRLAAGDWRGAARLWLIPLVAITRAARRLSERRAAGGVAGEARTWTTPFAEGSVAE